MENFFVVVDVPREWVSACQWSDIAELLDTMVDTYVVGQDMFGTLAGVTVRMVLCAHGKYWLIREGQQFIDNCDKFNAEHAPPELRAPNTGVVYEAGSPMPATCPSPDACLTAPRSPQAPESPPASRPPTPVVRVAELPAQGNVSPIPSMQAPRIKHIYIPTQWSERYSPSLLSAFVETLLPTYRDWLRIYVTLAGVRARLHKCPHGRFWFVPDTPAAAPQFQTIIGEFESNGGAANVTDEPSDIQHPSFASASASPAPLSSNITVELAGDQDGEEFNITFQVIDRGE